MFVLLLIVSSEEMCVYMTDRCGMGLNVGYRQWISDPSELIFQLLSYPSISNRNEVGGLRGLEVNSTLKGRHERTLLTSSPFVSLRLRRIGVRLRSKSDV